MSYEQKNINKWINLAIVCTGVFMSSMNASVINLANPTLAKEFSIEIDQVQWIVTVFLLVVSALMLFFGRLGDRIGSHKIYNSGFLFFTLGSLCCGFSSSFVLLILSRILQAVGAAMLMATGMGIVANSFPIEQRGQALGISVVAVGLGNMGGPGLGGIILHYLTWHYIFFINIPVGLLAFVFGLRYLRSPILTENKLPLDWLGSLLLALVISVLILVLSQSVPGSTWFILAFIVLLPLFWRYEKSHPAPLWDFNLLGNKRFSLLNLLSFISYFAQMSVFFLMPFYLEQIRLLPSSTVGLLIMVSPMFMAIFSPFSGMVSDKIGSLRMIPVAFIVILTAFLSLSLINAETSTIQIAISFGLMGSGMGMLNTPVNSEILTSAGSKHSGYASGFVATTRNLAFCLGTATAAGGFTTLLNYFSQTREYGVAYMDALRLIAISAAVLAFVGLGIGIWLKNLRTS